MAHKFDEYLYKEVFVIGPDDSVAAGEVNIFLNFEDLMQHMKTLSVENDANEIVLNGYLTPADVLPSSIKEKKVFIITLDGDDKSEATIIDVDTAIDVKALAMEVEDAVNGVGITFTTDIDDTFILYGYVVNKVLAPDDDDLDEEALSACKKISEEVEKIRTRNEKQLSKEGL